LRSRRRRGILGVVRDSDTYQFSRTGPLTTVIDATTLTDLWHQHADRLLLVAKSMGGPAEDAVQEAFVALASQRKLPADPMAWLVRVTRNRLLQWHRSQQRRRARESLVAETDWFDCQILTSQQRLEAKEVTSALQSLPSPDREIIVMHIWGEMTFESIARVVGGSSATAHRAFARGLASLRQQFHPDREVASMGPARRSVPRGF
jgi:RNA polymerase sigma factor (sigma-70 family)